MKILWTPYSKRSLRETVDFLSSYWNDDIADAFLTLVDKRLGQVKINPEMAPILPPISPDTAKPAKQVLVILENGLAL